VEGLVHISTLEDDIYTFVENKHSLIGRTRKRVLRIGDKARVKVAAVNQATRRIEFVLIEHASSTPQAPVSTESGEEYPRIPIRGKRLPGTARKSAAEERETPRNGTSQAKGKKSQKEIPKRGTRKHR